MSTATQHVLIIGGGLAGPCLALSLARRNIRSTIFEIRPTRSDSGGSISLTPNALQVLDRHAGVYNQVRAEGFTYYRFGAYTDAGEKLGEIAAGEEDKGDGGYPAVRVMRSILHKLLLDAGEEMGEMIEMKWGAKLSRIEEDEQGVTAHFEDESTARGDILVGADGIHSKVRQHVLGSQSPTPIFAGICIVTGFLPETSAITPSPDFTFPAFILTPSGFFMVIPTRPDGKTLAWGITMHAEQRTKDEWREFERSGEAARSAKANYADIQAQPVRSLLDNADDTTASIWVPYSIPNIPKWYTPRVCLIGDAAHALPPNGQGAAMAFEDAAILTRLLSSKQDTTSYGELFGRFEAIRRPRIDALRSARTAGGFMAKTGPWAWFFKKWAFRAFFALKRGVIRHYTPYDVDQVSLQM